MTNKCRIYYENFSITLETHERAKNQIIKKQFNGKNVFTVDNLESLKLLIYSKVAKNYMPINDKAHQRKRLTI